MDLSEIQTVEIWRLNFVRSRHDWISADYISNDSIRAQLGMFSIHRKTRKNNYNEQFDIYNNDMQDSFYFPLQQESSGGG